MSDDSKEYPPDWPLSACRAVDELEDRIAALEAEIDMLAHCIRDNTRTISVDMSGQHAYGFYGRPIRRRGSDVFEAIRKTYGGEGDT